MIVQAVYSGRYSGGEIERERDYRFTHAQWILITLWKERLTYALTLFKLKIKRNVFLVWTICLYSISSCAYLNLNQDSKTCKISGTGEVSIDVASTMARYQLIHFPWEWIIIYVEKTTNMKPVVITYIIFCISWHWQRIFTGTKLKLSWTENI